MESSVACATVRTLPLTISEEQLSYGTCKYFAHFECLKLLNANNCALLPCLVCAYTLFEFLARYVRRWRPSLPVSKFTVDSAFCGAYISPYDCTGSRCTMPNVCHVTRLGLATLHCLILFSSSPCSEVFAGVVPIRWLAGSYASFRSEMLASQHINQLLLGMGTV